MTKKKRIKFLPAQPVDHRGDQWCHLHALRLENPDHPTENDKKKIEAIRLKTIKQEQPDGTIKIFKYCPKCFMHIYVDTITRPLLAN